MSEDVDIHVDDTKAGMQLTKLTHILLGLLITVVSGFAGVIYSQVRDEVREQGIQLELNKITDSKQDVSQAELSKDVSGVQKDINKLETVVQDNFRGINQKLDILTTRQMERQNAR